MKTILIIYCAFMLTISANAQQSYQTLIKVEYKFIHVRDTTQRDKPYTETMLLVAGKEASFYTSFDRIEQSTAQLLKSLEDRKNGIKSSFSSKPVSQTYYYLFPQQHKYISYEPMTINYLVEGEIETITWKITKDTAGFSGIIAKKATATYKGRNWIAWFVEDMPLAYGPWELNGLPGLIIEAFDDKKEVQFKFMGIEKVKPGDTAVDTGGLSAQFIKSISGLDVSQINIISEGPVNHGGPVKITGKEYDKLKALRDKDPVSFMTAQFAAIGITDPAALAVSVSNGTVGGGGGSNNGANQAPLNVKRPAPIKNAINNPIELPQKK